jgi:hypothetical protein
LEDESGRLFLECEAWAGIEEAECSLLLGGLAVGFNITVPVARDDVASMSTRSRDDLSNSTGERRWPFDRKARSRLKAEVLVRANERGPRSRRGSKKVSAAVAEIESA